jgi:type II restriction/modification system DNA methylase subunit YeeA
LKELEQLWNSTSHKNQDHNMSINTANLKKFAQGARRQLREQVAGRLEQVLRSDNVELREKEAALKELRAEIAHFSKPLVIDRVAYTWFNRFCALRFMDVNHYTHMGVVSPAQGLSQPEILQEAKRGYIDDDLKAFVDVKAVFDLLNGQRPSADPQQEAYRLLVVGACNSYNTAMPFLFEKIADYTELLMPLDLLSENSVLHNLREALTPESCQDVEVIGWLYQYYISERKDEVFEALKQNQKIEATDIPAATQLFTPHWIVRYLVENSLGRLWMLNHPDSKLVDQMEYYIKPAQEETDFFKISSPEEIKLNDPACGSGHMLTYAFDLLYFIYEEAGYPTADIPHLILEKNLYGLEIDPRAGALAAFALTMKARAKDRRFISRGVQPNICVLENVTFTDQELDEYMRAVGRDLFTAPLLETLKQFEQADNFGSLIRPMLTDAGYLRKILDGKNLGGDLFLYNVHERVLKVLKQAEYLAPCYHVVVANPPYMGGAGMNDIVRKFAQGFYPDSKADLYAMFIERNLELVIKMGFLGMITMQNWMFLLSFERLREKLLQSQTLIIMAHLGVKAFDTLNSKVVSTTAFILQNDFRENYECFFQRITDGKNEKEKDELLKASISGGTFSKSKLVYHAAVRDLAALPGSPIAYWASKTFRDIFQTGKPLEEYAPVRQGFQTGENDKFMRFWFEVPIREFTDKAKNKEDVFSGNFKWVPYNKGGAYRKWFGNNNYVVAFDEPNYELLKKSGNCLPSRDLYFRESITWTTLSSLSVLGARYSPDGFTFSAKGACAFPKSIELSYILSFLNSKVSSIIMQFLSPTLDFNVGTVRKLPVTIPASDVKNQVVKNGLLCIDIGRRDWNSYEESWGFITSPLFFSENCHKKVSDIYLRFYKNCLAKTQEMTRLEEENNRIFFETYGLQDELTPETQLAEITLTCNPHFRYGGNRSDEELEALLKADTMKEFISYAVGCMFGRYSLDKPGLVLANQGETLQDYIRQVPEPFFMPDEDNVLPVLEGEWFNDDIVERFKQFLRVTFGEEHYAENMAFIEEAIGRDIRSYFVKDFYKDHVQMYKKRPIYWMFSSPKGSFNVLMYMHRYKPDTISIILNNYLRQYREKLNAHRAYQEAIGRNPSASQSERTKALREIDWVNKVLAELKEYEDEILYPLATQQIAIDLDDGVKVNYGKFGKALKPISGLVE